MTERELSYAIYSFSQHTLIKNIFIHELGAGDVGVLCGKPGCGKSTLIYQLGKDFPGRVVVFTATGLSGFVNWHTRRVRTENSSQTGEMWELAVSGQRWCLPLVRQRNQ